jgi:hypothetical protein
MCVPMVHLQPFAMPTSAEGGRAERHGFEYFRFISGLTINLAVDSTHLRTDSRVQPPVVSPNGSPNGL